MASSRIFVRGLPPSLTDAEFKKHFASQQPITDARLIPRRRIGYVGYKTADDASDAVRYFNKSFIRMSRIAVEIARPVSDVELPVSSAVQARMPKLDTVENPPSEAPSKSLKRKRDAPKEEDAKLQEFLEVMHPPSKSKTWANESLSTSAGPYLPQVPPQNQKTADDGEYQQIHSKDERVQSAPTNTSTKTVPVPPNTSETASTRFESQDGRNTLEPSGPANDLGASDSDWLRARTSRLLDLEEPGQDADPLQDQLSGDVEKSKGHEHESSPRLVNASAQTDQNMDDPSEESDSRPADSEAIEKIKSTGRLFLRNLPYSASESHLRHLFDPYGSLQEVHLPLDSSGTSKGFAYIHYVESDSAVDAYRNLDGSIFQGRLLHIIPSANKRENKLDDFAMSKLPLKKQRQLKRKMEAASFTFNWNSMYMNADAVMSSISDRLGISKSEILDPTSSDAAVKQAHSETHIIQETKAYFTSNGVNLDAFKQCERGETAIIVKNFSYGTNTNEIKALFEEFGAVNRVLMPPTGTIAIVEFSQAPQARAAFASLAYRRFRDSVLFLEKAPKGLFDQANENVTSARGAARQEQNLLSSEIFQSDRSGDGIDTTTLFVRNLNFSTNSTRLTDAFKPLQGFLSAKVKTKPDPKKPGETLSMGFGFVEFRTKANAQAALAAMNGYTLDAHNLLVRESHKAIDAGEERRREDGAKKMAGQRTKIIIKNLPFEASKKDVRSLFGSYGQLRSVRVPKKIDSSTRGFAFADFVSAREAENAMDALKDTHLLGRRLVLEFAAEDPLDAEEEIQKMQDKVGKQANKVALQRLAGSGRKKFNVDGGDHDD